MSVNQKHIKNIDNTGFGSNSSVEGTRLLNSDGTANLEKTGLPFWTHISIFHSLLRMKRFHFFVVIFLFYTVLNIIFAAAYFFIGVESLGIEHGTQWQTAFLEAFFFSSQTLTTVGYGKVAPSGMAANVVASLESLLGILSFAVVTGLIYGRFSRPRGYLMFSDNILIAPYKDGKAVMFRTASYKKHNLLTDVEVFMTLAVHIPENGKIVTKFYPLVPEISKINQLPLSWTIVHHINESSPLYRFKTEDFSADSMELLINIRAFDEHFSNIVVQRTSYTYNQFVYGAKFLPMFGRAASGRTTILDLSKLNEYERVPLPEKQRIAEDA
jgi:inward rectifier potassium channel